ncbi:hypothetical protein F5X96DRAFT_657737 [Biscogniauxia mediterranea]|nr:hypothetical protein F5X96DRAFT_657737 [Biscogniauxia mediterranea]
MRITLGDSLLVYVLLMWLSGCVLRRDGWIGRINYQRHPHKKSGSVLHDRGTEIRGITWESSVDNVDEHKRRPAPWCSN